MKAAFTADELAAFKLPGLPATGRGIRKLAKRHGFSGIERQARGGGTKYPLAELRKVLPPAALDALLDHFASAPAEAAPPAPVAAAVPANQTAAAPAESAALADWQRRCAEARAALLAEVDRLAALSGIEKAVRKVVDQAATGELRPELQDLVPIANARHGRTGKRTLSRRSLYRWRGDAATGWTELAPKDSAKPQPAPAWAPFLLRLYRTPTRRSLAAVLEDLPATLPAGVALPSYDQARRFLAKVSTVERERGRHGPNGLLQFKGFKRRSTEGLEPLDVVTADGHTFKADVAHPVHGRPFRPEVCALQDVVTRYVFGWSAGLAESTWVVMDSVRVGVERLGQFGLLYTDNGAGFVNHAMTAEAIGFLARIGATPTNSIPGRAQARGKIERLQQSLWKRGARALPTYNGRDMDSEIRHKVVKLVARDLKAAGGSRLLMPWAEFLAWAGAQVDAYNHRPHRSLPKLRDPQTGRLRHMSPAECLADWQARGWEPMTLPAAATADLFRPYELRTTRRGEVALPWGRYYHPALVDFGGERVRVGYDIHDGTKVWVRTAEDGRLICIAERDANMIPEQPTSKIDHARQVRADARLKLLEQHREEVLAERGPGLIDHQPEAPLSPELERRQAELVAAWSAPTEVVPLETPESRFARALGIERRLAAGDAVPEADRTWLERYRTQPEYRARRTLYEDFGDAVLTA